MPESHANAVDACSLEPTDYNVDSNTRSGFQNPDPNAQALSHQPETLSSNTTTNHEAVQNVAEAANVSSGEPKKNTPHELESVIVAKSTVDLSTNQKSHKKKLPESTKKMTKKPKEKRVRPSNRNLEGNPTILVKKKASFEKVGNTN